MYHNRWLVLLLWVTLSINRFVASTTAQQHSINRWVSCIGEIVYHNAATVKHELNVYTLSESATGYRFMDDLLDRLLPSLVAHDPGARNASLFTFNLARYERTVDYNQRNLVLILMDDLQQLYQHLPSLVAKNVEQRGYFLLLITPREDADGTAANSSLKQQMANLFRQLWDVRIHNVVLAIGHNASRIDLHAYDPYGPGCCGCSRPKLLTQCRAGKLMNSTGALYDRFERNLYGCQLKIACFEREPFMQFVNDSEESLDSATTNQRLAGIEGSLVDLLATQLNFTVAIVQPTDGRTWGRIYPNGTSNGALGLLLNGTVHLTVGGFFPYPRLLSNTTQSHYYYISDLVMAVPEALATLSPLEQLLKPFHLTIWLLLALELVLGFAALRPCSVSLHFWRVFIGESLPDSVKPKRTQTRFVLLLWIIHSTLLRESYKGSLVGFLTQVTPLNDIHSLAALVQAGYRFAMTETIYHKVFDESQHRFDEDRVQLIKSADGLALLEQTIRTGERLAFAYTREEIIKFNERNRSDLNYRTSDEKLLTFHFAMYFKRSSPIAATFDWYIRRVQATGFIARWHHESLDLRFERPTLAVNGQAEVLQVHHLLGSYLILMVGLLLATVVFTLELLYDRLTRSLSASHPYPYLHELIHYPE
uniref:Ionotropic glutamate receptor L-glutamate and glycine-binding domain-containing protein n=1 Tax=Anopheles culicifacies TaxID=139723 RepID=A0A182MI97_9DIPT